MSDWFLEFEEAAARTDQFSQRPNHAALLAAGLLGEVGSVLAEIKKEVREAAAYPGHRRRLVEELGDVLWYFTRLARVSEPDLLGRIASRLEEGGDGDRDAVTAALALGRDVGGLWARVEHGRREGIRRGLLDVAVRIGSVARLADVGWPEAARWNRAKIESRWPSSRKHAPLFDSDFPVYEQLPRQLEVEFIPIERGKTESVLLRCRGLNMGDRLTDNAKDPDSYRYHDVIHLSYAAFLGWSPVIRSLLKCKRKSNPDVDEVEDGARAAVAEEAVSFAVFRRAKEMSLFKGVERVDFDLLKAVRQLVVGLEVAALPYWQWEEAILEGYRVFRRLTRNRGGAVEIDLNERRVVYRRTASSSGGATGS